MPDKWYVVDPRRSLVVGWDFYMVVLLLFTIFVTPFEVCFLSFGPHSHLAFGGELLCGLVLLYRPVAELQQDDH